MQFVTSKVFQQAIFNKLHFDSFNFNLLFVKITKSKNHNMQFCRWLVKGKFVVMLKSNK